MGAFLALGGLGAREGAPQTTSTQPASASATAPGWQSSSPVEVFYYVVESEAQAVAVESAVVQSGAKQIEVALGGGPLNGGPGVHYSVINTDSYEGRFAAENLLGASSEIANHPGVFVTVVDLRSR